MDKVQCDVILLNVSHSSWTTKAIDKKAQHYGSNNTNSFKYHNTKVKMMPSKKFPSLKFKMTVGSFLLKHVPYGGDRNLRLHQWS